MKLLKNTLYIAAFMSINTMDARKIEETTQPTPQPVPAPVTTPVPQTPAQIATPPALPGTGFQYYLSLVRSWPSSDVINAQGVMTDKFISLVQSSKLAPDFQGALLEAGRNLHLPLSGDNIKDAALLIKTNQNIADMKTRLPVISAPEAESFYNTKTNLFNIEFLNKEVTLLGGENQKGSEIILGTKLMPMITSEWKKRGIPVTPGQVDAARQQIITAINTQYKKWNAPAKQVSSNDWYDGWNTHLLNQVYLNQFIQEAVDLRKKNIVWQNELNALEKKVKLEWNKEGISQEAQNELSVKLNKQLAKTAAAIQNKAGLKAEIEFSNFWDTKTNLLKKEYLNDQVQLILKQPKNKNLTALALTNILLNQHLDDMQHVWQIRNLNVNEYSKELFEQIKDAFTEAMQGNQKAAVNPPYPDWYDKKEKLFNPDILKQDLPKYLENNNFDVDKATKALLSEVIREIQKIWTAENINYENQQLLANALSLQIKNAMTAYKRQQKNAPKPSSTQNPAPGQKITQQDQSDLNDMVTSIMKKNKNQLMDAFIQTAKGDYEFNSLPDKNWALDEMVSTAKERYPNVTPEDLTDAIIGSYNWNIKITEGQLYNWYDAILNYFKKNWNLPPQPIVAVPQPQPQPQPIAVPQPQPQPIDVPQLQPQAQPIVAPSLPALILVDPTNPVSIAKNYIIQNFNSILKDIFYLTSNSTYTLRLDPSQTFVRTARGLIQKSIPGIERATMNQAIYNALIDTMTSMGKVTTNNNDLRNFINNVGV